MNCRQKMCWLLAMLAGAFAWGARADSPSVGVLSFNMRNEAGAGDVTAACETKAGTIPVDAWQENTTDVAGSNHAGCITGVKGWDGRAATTYSDTIFSWGCNQGLVNNIYETTVESYPFLKRVFGRGSGDRRSNDLFSLAVTNVPYAEYDVIVYLSGSGCTSFQEAVTINGVQYYGSTSELPYGTVQGSPTTTWGLPANAGLDYGVNVLRVNSLSGDLTLQYTGNIGYLKSWTVTGNAGIAAFQIVEVPQEPVLPTEPIASAPTEVARTTFAVYTNGVLSSDGIVLSNRSAYVVYTCDAGGSDGGYYFADWSTVSTNQLDTTVNPAVCVTAPDRVYCGEDELPLGDFNFNTMTFSRASGLSLGRYRQLTILLSREIEAESVTLPTVAGYTLDTKISTDYSFVINIDGEGKTSAEIASEYIRNIVFSGCREQLVRCLLSWKRSENKVFFYEGTRHYYQYIPFATANAYSWTNCYAKARAMTYLGRTGYLATITSFVEDKLAYKATGHCVGWLGGTSCIAGDEDGMYYNTFAPHSSTSHWYWACGPERGQEFFDWAQTNTSCTTEIYARNAEKGYYFNWDSLGPTTNAQRKAQREPDGCIQLGKYFERFLTTLGFGYGYTTQGSVDDGKLGDDVYGWNDLKEDGNIDGESKWDVLGYLVEFGDQTVGDSNEDVYQRGVVVTERRIHAPVVTYDAGEGEFSNGDKTNVVIHLDAGAGYVLPTNAPTRTDYHLKGWYTNLADSATAVMAGSPLYSRDDHRVYALWAEGGYTTAQVVTNETGGTIEVQLPETELASRGGDANRIEPNGNRVWENIVLGLPSNRVVVTGARQNDREDRITIVAENLDVPPADTGLAVTYYVDHVSPNGRVRGKEESHADQMNGLWIDLTKVVTNDYYKVRVVISNDVCKKEFVATNTMGVLKQYQHVTNLIVATPWGKLAPLQPDEDLEVPISDVLKTSTLDPGDELRVYRQGASTYESWFLQEDWTWAKMTTVKVTDANAAPQIAQASEPTEATVPRGSGLWLCRKEERKGQPYYLFGQVNGDDSKYPIVKGPNLAGATGVSDYDLNAHVTGATAQDEIVIPGTNEVPRVLTYRDGAWGYWATGPAKTVTFMGVEKTTYETIWVTNAVIRPGTGYWLHNTSGKIEVK